MKGAESAVPAPPPREWRLLRGPGPATVTLLVLLGATLAGWVVVGDLVRQQEGVRVESRIEEMRLQIENRMGAYVQVLRGARGMMEIDPGIDRSSWQRYIESLRLEDRHAGVQGVGYAQWVPAGARLEHVAAVRASGMPEYRLWPDGTRADAVAILYLEPNDWRNRRALGFDMFSEPVRRAALERARDTGEPALTARVKLVQESDQDVQAGTLMFLPVYRDPAAATDVESRRRLLRGFVYSPFRMADLMRATLEKFAPDMDVHLYDGSEAVPQALMYDSDRGPDPADDAARSVRVHVAGRDWTMTAAPLAPLVPGTSSAMPIVTLVAGLIISLLTSSMVWAITSTRSRALALARSMTAQLRRADQRLSFALRAVVLGSWSWHPADDSFVADSVAARLLGLPDPESSLGRVLSALPEADRLKLRQQFRSAASGSVDVEAEVSLNLPGGGVRHVSLRGCRQDDPAGPAQVVGFCWDVTHERETSLQLQRRGAELERSNQELERFAYITSHNLQGPLRGISGFARLLERRYRDKIDDQGREFIDHVVDGVEQMRRLIIGVLDVARAGQGALHLEPTALDEVLDEALGQLQGLIAERHAQVHRTPLPKLAVDRTRMVQLFHNLVENAIKFQPQGAPEVRVWAVRESRAWIFHVSDHGIGIPPEMRAQLFRAFQRLNASPQFEGSGVGLAICQRIVLAHGGEIWVEPNAGEGSTFSFRLPLLAIESSDADLGRGPVADRPPAPRSLN